MYGNRRQSDNVDDNNNNKKKNLQLSSKVKVHPEAFSPQKKKKGGGMKSGKQTLVFLLQI